MFVQSPSVWTRRVQHRLPPGSFGLYAGRMADVPALLERGFRLGCIAWHASVVRPEDRETCAWLDRQHPDLPVLAWIRSESPERERLRSLGNVLLLPPRQTEEDAAQSLLRSMRAAASEEREIEIYPGILLLPNYRCLDVQGKVVRLTEKEQALLLYLWNRRGLFVSAGELIDGLWDEYATADIVRQYVYRLRKKLDAPQAPANLIAGVKGIGYMLVKEFDETLLQLIGHRSD